MTTKSICRFASGLLILWLSLSISTACSNMQPNEMSNRWQELPRTAAEILAHTPLASGNLDRYLIHVKREAFKSSGTSIGPETIENIWYRSGGGISPAKFEDMQRAFLDDFNGAARPYKRSYTDFVIRGFSPQDSSARILVTERYGGSPEYLVELTLRWDGSRWQNESIVQLPWPPPDKD